MKKLAQNSPPEGRRFKPGKSGNPGGRPKEEREVALLLRARGPEVAAKLVKLALNGNVAAIKEFNDRAYGKAKQILELTGADGGPVEVLRLDPKTLTKEQLELLAQVSRTALGKD